MKLRKLRQRLNVYQNGLCLVCAFPLELGAHVHHVIAREDRGPDHELNLVALCPNHHGVLELVRQHIAPNETHQSLRWGARAGAAAGFLRSMPGHLRVLFDCLSQPHPLREPIRHGVDASLRLQLAHQIATADTRLLLETNLARPALLIVNRVSQGRMSAPTNESEFEAALITVTRSARN